MINNYILAYNCSEKENIIKFYNQIFEILKVTKRENIVLIIDSKRNILKKLFDEILSIEKEDSSLIDNKAQNLKAAITEIFGSGNNLGFKKFHQVDFEYSENNLETYINELKSKKIPIDAIITIGREKINIEGIKQIKLEEFQYHQIEDKRAKIYDEGLIDFNEVGKNKIEKYLEKAVWNSEIIYIYDYHLQHLYRDSQNDQRIYKSWKLSFEFFLNNFSKCRTFKDKITIKIITPFPKIPTNIRDEGKGSVESHLKECSRKIFKLFESFKDQFNIHLNFMDSKIGGSEYMHDRFIQFKSCTLGVGRGADFVDWQGNFKEGSMLKHEKITVKYLNKLTSFNKIEFLYPN